MIEIKQSKISNLETHIPKEMLGKRLVVGVLATEIKEQAIRNSGLSFPLIEGEVIVPRVNGSVSKVNANGKERVRRDLDKETCYRQMEFTRKEWRGRGEVEEVSDCVWIPYKRYPREIIPPYGIEFKVTKTTDQRFMIVCDLPKYDSSSLDIYKHSINLFLEFFDICLVFEEGRVPTRATTLIRLNWKLLPSGKYPWERIEEHIRVGMAHQKPKSLVAALNRFEKISSFNPDFRAIGDGGYKGYVVFGFTDKDLYVFESQFPNNAIYVFGGDWEQLSKLTKAEIISSKVHIARIIHGPDWFSALSRIIK